MTEVLRVSHLKAGYGKKTVLEDVSFTVASREIRIILGTSGCGKSTLLNNILGLEHAFSGEISFWGKTLRAGVDLMPDSIRTRTGVLFQSGALLSSLTVAQNVALPLALHRPRLSEAVVRDMVADCLEKVHLLQAYHKMPSELSGGMRKRAALARAIILSPQLLFCDEPSAGLDPVTSRSLDDLLLELRETLDVSLLVVTHELDSIRAIGDRLLFLQSGKVLLDGSLAEGLASPVPEIKSFFARNADAVLLPPEKLRFNFEEDR